jgi:hypothetical protein
MVTLAGMNPLVVLSAARMLDEHPMQGIGNL